MEFMLVVVQPFGPHAVGDVVRDADAVAAILHSENAGCVVRIRPPEG